MGATPVQCPFNGQAFENRLATPALSRSLKSWRQEVSLVGELLQTRFLANANLQEAP